MFKLHQIVKRNDTGEHVQIIDVIPLGRTIFYRIEYESGDSALVLDTALRAITR